MIRIIITALALAVVGSVPTTTAAQAQQTVIRDGSGKIVGRAVTGSDGSRVTYDSSGRAVIRESTSGNQTTVYDDKGRPVGKFTTPQR